MSTNRILIFLLLFVCPSFLYAQKKWVVAAEGSGQFRTVQAALNAVPLHNKKPITIFIKNGTYREKLYLDSTKDNVTIIGENKFNTILTYDDHTGKLSPAGDTINTWSSWSFKIKANRFTAKHITFQNNAGFTAGQAVALESDGDQAYFSDCRFVGNQDVLFTNSPTSRQLFRNCYIEGSTDFIFGAATAWFEQCHIHSKKNSHVTAASTPPEKKYGYVFYDCVLTGDTTLHNVSLGRPWQRYGAVVYLYCYLGPHFRAEGWSNWNTTDYYKTARYAEYLNRGPGADTTRRLNWTRQLSKEEASEYTIRNVLGDWVPVN